MNESSRKLLKMAAAAGLALLMAPASAQTTANGPYYATPSWDQTLPSNTRFIVLSNFNGQAVLDRETGLVWERSPETFTNTYSQAHDECNRRRVGNRFGWRLPTAAELASLLDPATSSPALPVGHPFQNVQVAPGQSFYWTTSTDLRFPGNAYAVDFRIPSVISAQVSDQRHVWCVRGGLGASTQ